MIPAKAFLDIDKLILKLIWKHKGPKLTKATLKKNKVRGITLPTIKAHYIVAVIKTV